MMVVMAVILIRLGISVTVADDILTDSVFRSSMISDEAGFTFSLVSTGDSSGLIVNSITVEPEYTATILDLFAVMFRKIAI